MGSGEIFGWTADVHVARLKWSENGLKDAWGQIRFAIFRQPLHPRQELDDRYDWGTTT